MSKKHYQKLAEIIRSVHYRAEDNEEVAQTIRDIAVSLARVCADDNPRFDRDRFFKSCGYPD